jgi:hypothetical protein
MILRLGSMGAEVNTLQQRLTHLGFYSGAVDGVFGGGTESAVRRFQRASAINEDGLVGDETWRLIVGEAPPVPAITREELPTRCLALTASFETGAAAPECFATVVGDFDGMGISFGALQWNIGTGTLQSLLQDIEHAAPGVINDVFHEQANTLRSMLMKPLSQQLAWARSIQHTSSRRLDEPWQGLFKTLGRTQACIAAQTRGAAERYHSGLALCGKYGLWSERAAAFMFDLVVQNGSIRNAVDEQIRADVSALGSLSREETEVRTMEIIATRRAAVSRPQFQSDVLQRKLTIARGKGHVHGRAYELEDGYGIRLVERSTGVVAGNVAERNETPAVSR